MKNTPARFFAPPSCKKLVSNSNGFQIAFPNITVDELETIIPINDVRAKQIGIAKSWGKKASFGFLAKRAKSGALTISVAKLAIALMIPLTIPQASAEPWAVFFSLTIGPRPLARTMAQMKKLMPQMGTTKDLKVKRWRILWTGNQIAGSEQSQNIKKDTNAGVDVPDVGMPLGRL